MDVIPNLWLCGVWLNSSEREGTVLYTYKPCITLAKVYNGMMSTGLIHKVHQIFRKDYILKWQKTKYLYMLKEKMDSH